MDSSFYESDNVTQGKFYCIRNGCHLSYSFIRIPSIKWSCALIFFIAFTRSAEDFMFAIKSFTVLYWWWFKRVRPRQIYSRYFLIQVNRLSNLPGCQMPGWFCCFILGSMFILITHVLFYCLHLSARAVDPVQIGHPCILLYDICSILQCSSSGLNVHFCLQNQLWVHSAPW